MASWIRGGETGERPTTVSWIRQQESAPGKPAPTRNKSGWNETRSPPLTPLVGSGFQVHVVHRLGLDCGSVAELALVQQHQ